MNIPAKTAKFPKLVALPLLIAMFQVASVRAGSATWKDNPSSGNWRAPANWTPTTVPDSETDTATFDASSITTVYLGREKDFDYVENDVASIVFGADAGPYTIVIAASHINYYSNILTFWGAGIVNNSGQTQNFVVGGGIGEAGRIYFQNQSAVGDNVVITAQGPTTSEAFDGAFISFGFQYTDAPNAGNATYINEGATASGTQFGGFTVFTDFSAAGAATFINQPGTVAGAAPGHTQINTFGDLGTSTFINNAATVPGAEGGWTQISYGNTSGAAFIANGASIPDAQGGQVYVYGQGYDTGEEEATFTANGGTASGAEGGLVDIYTLGTNVDQQAVVIANGGTNGGLGGTILLEHKADVLLGQFQLYGNGVLDLTNLASHGALLGSLGGDGLVNLAGHNLSIGNGNQSTIFSGVISGSGNVTKLGGGTLALNGINTYAGNTIVTAGTLGGSGTIPGTLAVAAGATVAPAAGATTAATFTIEEGLTIQASGTYSCLLSGTRRQAKSDQVIANGVTFKSGAQFVLTSQIQGKLVTGTVFTIVSNTASTPISGTFANLADGATLTVNGTTFQASYEGGDGNDLTLTVQ